jgi:cell division protease FtsH
MLTQGSVAAHLQLKLAGRAAEALLCGDMSSGSGAGAQSDLAQATQLALEAEANFGFGPQIAWHSLGRPLTLMPAEICRRVEERLQRAAAEVRELLASHAPSLEKIAAELLAARDLSATDLARLLAAIPGRAGNVISERVTASPSASARAPAGHQSLENGPPGLNGPSASRIRTNSSGVMFII